MFSHDRIWQAIDALAARNGLTASGLARRAGLDPTAFNKSKRVGSGGRLRWPSTESIAKVLDATGTAPEDLVALLRYGERKGRAAEPHPSLMDGHEAASAIMATVHRPGTMVYVVPEEGLPPLYRKGNLLLVDQDEPVVPGARILVMDHAGRPAAGEVVSLDDDVALAVPGQDGNIRRHRNVAFVARIVWASQ